MAGISTALVNPPVSGVAYQNVTGADLHGHFAYTLNPLVAANASVVARISPDGVTWTIVGGALWPLAVVPITGSQGMLHAFIPAGWFYSITAINAVLGFVVALTNS